VPNLLAELKKIVNLPADEHQNRSRGSMKAVAHTFFGECILGGRYEFNATGMSKTQPPGELMAAVADTTDFATSASATYAGIGGRLRCSRREASGGGQQGKGKQVRSKRNERTSVEVQTSTLGEPPFAVRDVWVSSLKHSSTWAVIDAIADCVVELVANDASWPPTSRTSRAAGAGPGAHDVPSMRRSVVFQPLHGT